MIDVIRSNPTTDNGAVRVKVCGITNRADLKVAIEAGADAIGLVFYPLSPRYVTQEQAVELTADLPPFIAVTGLFVNASRQDIIQVTNRCRLDIIQLHGNEPPSLCQGMPRRVIKAVRVASKADLADLDKYPVSAMLLDAKVKGLYGGSGETFDWSLLAAYHSPAPMVLAGGLNPDNVALAISQVRPYAVDVSSGVESQPGIKDPALVKRFIREVKQASFTPNS